MLSIKMYAQNNIDSMYTFNYFEKRGITTAGAYSQFNNLLKQKANKIYVIERDKQDFEQMLNSAKPKKHQQTKLGIDNLFGVMYTNGKPINFVICSNMLVFDITNSCNYWIENEADRQWLFLFIKRVKNEKLD